MIVTHIHRHDHGTERVEGIIDFAALLREENTVFWCDFYAPTDEESFVLTGDFKFHPLAIEDVISEAPAPKLDVYDDYLFTVAKIADSLSIETGLNIKEVDVFLLKNAVVTIHFEPVKPLDLLARRCEHDERILSRGADFAFHAVLDFLVDHYTHVMDQFDEIVDQIEDTVFEETDEAAMKRIFNIKRDLASLKRLVAPQREILHRFSRHEFDLIGEQTRIYFRDVYDHLMRINELADTHREALTSALEAFFYNVSARTNEIIKILTIFSAIMLPLTFVTGLYGMNFSFMPELNWEYGYIFFWILIVGIVGGTILFLKRREWL